MTSFIVFCLEKENFIFSFSQALNFFLEREDWIGNNMKPELQTDFQLLGGRNKRIYVALNYRIRILNPYMHAINEQTYTTSNYT